MKIKYLTIEEVLFIHDQSIKRFGGSSGLRDIGLLESAVYRSKDKTIFDKAVALMHSLLKNHPFVDGNKRTALSSAGIFLSNNGYILENKGKKELNFALQVENKSLSLEQIAEWLKEQSVKKA